jgi:hypothetical protein
MARTEAVVMNDSSRLEALVAAARAREAPWSESRENASLTAILEASSETRGRPRRLLAGLVAAAASLALVTVGFWWRSREVREPTQLIAPTVVAAELSFPGDAIGYAEPHAAAEVVTASVDEVRVRQRRGRIEYHVAPRKPRRFIVEASDIEIAVLGTAFAVSVEDGRVRVEVAHGRVQVKRGDDVVILSDRESVSLSDDAFAADAGHDPEPPAVLGEELDAGLTATPPKRRSVSLEQGLEKSDELRRKGQYVEAVAMLRKSIAKNPVMAQSPAAHFSLGRAEQGAGRQANAARAFERCFELGPKGPIAEDAIAEAAFAWSRAGDSARAERTARRALEAFPNGLHAARLTELVR